YEQEGHHVEAEIELNPGRANGWLAAFVDRQLFWIRLEGADESSGDKVDKDKEDGHHHKQHHVSDQFSHEFTFRFKVSQLLIGRFQADLPATRKTRIELMPMGDLGLAQLPAQIDFALPHPRWKVNQSRVEVLQLDTQSLQFFLILL